MYTRTIQFSDLQELETFDQLMFAFIRQCELSGQAGDSYLFATSDPGVGAYIRIIESDTKAMLDSLFAFLSAHDFTSMLQFI